MFTGIVEEMGRVVRCEKLSTMELWDGSTGTGWLLAISGEKMMEGVYIGCSVAVNGVCLTVTRFDSELKICEFNFTLETAKRTNLPDLQAGDYVNLERAASSDSRNSGHMVQGHVDGTGRVISLKKEGAMLWVRIGLSKDCNEDLLRYIVEKGYVALDGASLTVCEVNRKGMWFSVMLVPHTQKHIVMAKRTEGDAVNVEVDVIAKYVERSVGTERIERAERRANLAAGGVVGMFGLGVLAFIFLSSRRHP